MREGGGSGAVSRLQQVGPLCKRAAENVGVEYSSVIERALAALATSSVEDEALLVDEVALSTSPRRRLALQYRLEQKHMLQREM